MEGPQGATAQRPRILVVEDEAIVAHDIRLQLLELGYEPLGPATRGEQAVEMAGSLHPDLVLMDVQLAGPSDGIAAAQEIRTRFSLPVVFLTAFAGDETLARAKLTEPFGYVLKPFSERELRTVLEMAIYKHRADARLRESEARYRELFEGNPHPMWVYDLETLAFLAVNDAAIAHYGYRRREFLAMTTRDLRPAEDVTHLMDQLTRNRQPAADAGLCTHLRKDGSTILVEVSSHALLFGGQRAKLVLAHDVTERKWAEQQILAGQESLRESAQHSQAILDNMVDGVITINARGLMESFNKAASRIFGYTTEEVLGCNVSMLMPDPHQGRHDAYLDHYHRTGQERLIGKPREMEGRRKDGSLFPLSLSVSRIARAGEAIYIGLVRDITERTHAEAVLRESGRQLQALSRRVLEAQETERRRVAHELHDELGQSLTAIKINLQARERFKEQSQDELNAENMRMVEDALQQVRRLALALRPSMLDDLGLVPALRWMAEQSASRSDIAVRFEPRLPPVRLAPEIETACFRIAQEALTNIARYARAQVVEITLAQDADTLVLCVQDDGCGFDVAAMRARAMAGGSIGVLGMQERAALIGGQLDIDSSPGRGSTVRLRCPWRLRT